LVTFPPLVPVIDPRGAGRDHRFEDSPEIPAHPAY